MSALPNVVYANPTTPCWAPAGSGGGTGPTGPTGPAGLTNPVAFIEFTPATGSTGTVSQTLRSVTYPYNNASVVGVLNGTDLDGLRIGDSLVVSSSGPPSTQANMLYKWNGADFQEAGSGTTYNILDINVSNIPPLVSLTNIDAFSQKFGVNAVLQPKIQYGEFPTSGTSGSNTVTLSFPYTSSSNYVVMVTMEDTSPARMSALRVSSNSFDVHWANASGGSHTIAWTTFGDA